MVSIQVLIDPLPLQLPVKASGKAENGPNVWTCHSDGIPRWNLSLLALSLAHPQWMQLFGNELMDGRSLSVIPPLK